MWQFTPQLENCDTYLNSVIQKYIDTKEQPLKITLNYFAKFVSKASILFGCFFFFFKQKFSISITPTEYSHKNQGLTFKDAMVVDSFSLQRPLLSDLLHLCTRARARVLRA